LTGFRLGRYIEMVIGEKLEKISFSLSTTSFDLLGLDLEVCTFLVSYIAICRSRSRSLGTEMVPTGKEPITSQKNGFNYISSGPFMFLLYDLTCISSRDGLSLTWAYYRYFLEKSAEVGNLFHAGWTFGFYFPNSFLDSARKLTVMCASRVKEDSSSVTKNCRLIIAILAWERAFLRSKQSVHRGQECLPAFLGLSRSSVLSPFTPGLTLSHPKDTDKGFPPSHYGWGIGIPL